MQRSTCLRIPYSTRVESALNSVRTYGSLMQREREHRYRGTNKRDIWQKKLCERISQKGGVRDEDKKGIGIQYRTNHKGRPMLQKTRDMM
jgi:hypothetical protein